MTKEQKAICEAGRVAAILAANPNIGKLTRRGKAIYYTYLNGVAYREHKDPAALIQWNQ